MVDGPELEEGKYPFAAERLPLSDLAWIEFPALLKPCCAIMLTITAFDRSEGNPSNCGA